jgi:hypothetical protein
LAVANPVAEAAAIQQHLLRLHLLGGPIIDRRRAFRGTSLGTKTALKDREGFCPD